MIPQVELSAGVVLRTLRFADAEPLAAAYARNRTHLAPWEPVRSDEFFTVGWHRAEILRQLTAASAGSSLALVLASGGKVIGRVNVAGIVRGSFQSASLGYWIDVAHTGQGLMSAAVRAVVGIAREDLDLHRLEAGTLVHNDASQAVLRTVGFEYIGLAPRYLRIAGEWQDHRLFQLILHD